MTEILNTPITTLNLFLFTLMVWCLWRIVILGRDINSPLSCITLCNVKPARIEDLEVDDQFVFWDDVFGDRIWYVVSVHTQEKVVVAGRVNNVGLKVRLAVKMGTKVLVKDGKGKRIFTEREFK